jgi:hypothetical protein
LDFTKDELAIIYDSVKIAYGIRNIDSYDNHRVYSNFNDIFQKIAEYSENNKDIEIISPFYVDKLIPY